MKLQPRLVKSTMWMVCSGESGSIFHKLVSVELWERVGLAIHEYNDVVGLSKWRISHVQSGRSILRYMKSREQVIEYLMKVNEWGTMEGLNVNWNMTEEQFKNIYNREEVIVMLNGLQKQISGDWR